MNPVIHHPSRSFDDRQANLHKWIVDRKKQLPGYTADDAKADSEAQRKERLEYEAKRREWASARVAFARNQAARARRFNTALRAFLSLHRDDQAMTAELSQLQARYARRSGKATPELPIAPSPAGGPGAGGDGQ